MDDVGCTVPVQRVELVANTQRCLLLANRLWIEATLKKNRLCVNPVEAVVIDRKSFVEATRQSLSLLS